jgi:hypothetical protein
MTPNDRRELERWFDQKLIAHENRMRQIAREEAVIVVEEDNAAASVVADLEDSNAPLGLST